MSYRSNIVYRYDGSYDGMMCCIFECFRAKEEPASIEFIDAAQETLFPVKYIETDMELSMRVKKSIPSKISVEAEELVKNAYLTCLDDRELKILCFLHLGYRLGPKVTKLITNEDVYALDKAVKYLKREAHFSLEFLRFSEFGDFLAAQITPKNNVLPLIVGHFCDRFPDENFVIFDKNRKTAFIHCNNGETRFMFDAEIEFPEVGEEEERYRQLWRHFYDTIAVEGRVNYKLRMNMMPKRYWVNMTEFNRMPSKSIDDGFLNNKKFE